eukprot:Colp12_sorted_trinity150504_noHs@23644
MGFSRVMLAALAAFLVVSQCFASTFKREVGHDITASTQWHSELHVLNNPQSVKFDSKSAAPLTHLSEVLATVFGIPSAGKDSFDVPAVDILHRPRAQAVFILDSEVASAVKLSAKATFTLNHAPMDALAGLVTGLSGRQASEHGIVGRKWADLDGSIERAFSSMETLSSSKGVADVLAEATSGESLVVSFSSDRLLAKAAGIHERGLYNGINSYTFSYDGKNNHFVRFGNTRAQNIDLPKEVSAPLKSFITSLKTDVAPLSMDKYADRLFFVELLGAQTIISQLKAANKASGSNADLFICTFYSVEKLVASYGKNSAEVEAAVRVLNEVLPQLVSQFTAAYGGSSVSYVLALTEGIGAEVPMYTATVKHDLRRQAVSNSTNSST